MSAEYKLAVFKALIISKFKLWGVLIDFDHLDLSSGWLVSVLDQA